MERLEYIYTKLSGNQSENSFYTDKKKTNEQFELLINNLFPLTYMILCDQHPNEDFVNVHILSVHIDLIWRGELPDTYTNLFKIPYEAMISTQYFHIARHNKSIEAYFTRYNIRWRRAAAAILLWFERYSGNTKPMKNVLLCVLRPFIRFNRAFSSSFTSRYSLCIRIPQTNIDSIRLLWELCKRGRQNVPSQDILYLKFFSRLFSSYSFSHITQIMCSLHLCV